MIAWQISKKRQIEQIEKKEFLDDFDNSKIKITKIILDKHVFQAYNGLGKFPIIPASFSTGIVTEFEDDGAYDFTKGSKVYISSFKNCNNCFNCITDNPRHCSNMSFLGRNVDGVLKDFAIIPNSQIFELPPIVNEKDALFLDIIALNITTIDKLESSKGQHVLVIGNGIQALVACQLLSYYKSVPIILTNDKYTYDLADELGIFYKYHTTDNLSSNVSKLTGGRMASKIIYFTDSKININYIGELSASNAKVMLSGFDYSNINISIENIMNKQLEVSCVTNGFGEIKSAINLLANKAIETSLFNLKEIKFSDVEKYLNSFNSEEDFIPCIVNTMI